MAGKIRKRSTLHGGSRDRSINAEGWDIVLCKVHGAEYLHLVKAVQDGRFQIGNNKGRINGWIGANGIYGMCVRVE